MKTLTVREMRSALAHLEDLVAEEGELVVTRRGRPLARIVPAASQRRIPSRADLRATIPKLKTPSELLIRRDRESR